MGAVLTATQALVPQVEKLEKLVASQASEIVGLKSTIDELNAKLTPPPSTTNPTVVGSSAYPGSVTAFDELESLVGKLGAWRIFIPNVAPGDTDVFRVKTAIGGGRRAFVSVTGITDETKAIAAAKQFVTKIKPLGGEGTITFGHEPTQKFGDPKAYVRAKNAYYRTIREQLPNWLPIDIFMLWDIEAGGARHPDNWIADLDLLEGLGVDAYDQQGKKSPEKMLAPALALADKYNKPLFVTETSTIEKAGDPDYKPNWIKQMTQYCAGENRIPTWIWFHSKVGQNAPPEGWYINTSDAAVDAFKGAVAGQ